MLLKTINKIKVHPAPLEKVDPKKIKGFDICPEIYSNIFICSKKKSGKTTLIYNIMKKCADKDTIFYIFCSTLDKDKTYKHIIKYFEDKGNEVNTYKSINDSELNEILDNLKSTEDIELEEEVSEEEEPQVCIFESDDIEIKVKKKRKKKYIAPEYFFIFDDLSTGLRSPALDSYLKKNRHFRAKTIISSQWLKDLLPSSRRQLDMLILFGGHTEPKLENIHEELDLSLPFYKFKEMYQNATSEKYGFLYVDIINEEYRKCFNKKYMLNKK